MSSVAVTIATTTQPAHDLEDNKHATNELLKDASEQHTKPLWAQMARLNPPLPNPKCQPHVWEYDRIRPSLLRAGELITEKQAERRVLMLVNPARDAPYTTDTIYAGLQLVMPNETAPAHRHTAFACRFIIEGNGGFTAVHGKRIQMQRGDVILTPSWNWHDHGKNGSGPMIWIDGLDLPQFVHYPVHFVEHYASPRYPASDVDISASLIVFPWTRMKSQLDAIDGDCADSRYLKENGSEISRTLGAEAIRVNAGAFTQAIQETASSIFHVIEGAGSSTIDGKIYQWKKGDTFCVPAWHEYQHRASDGQTVYLYRVHDEPMLKALGFYRRSGQDVEALVSE
ncbi:RmlC-like cupin [Paraphaeosphaeria sporulosa]|uniref:RmlC-like cupin n=1 Tax=Paraphaeosphaeria sporulosa TaxID=1460663 RepID=A0A177CHY2_9PLEO|nr:RmlC-like cupin [Paraphaeosphaeria sporulosa]OAG07135.1 RmlC-like cupin [Paraphaeosphaeria sporulosa]